MALPISPVAGVYGFVELAPMPVAARLEAKRATTLAAGPGGARAGSEVARGHGVAAG